jgi:hypothetical protein
MHLVARFGVALRLLLALLSVQLLSRTAAAQDEVEVPGPARGRVRPVRERDDNRPKLSQPLILLLPGAALLLAGGVMAGTTTGDTTAAARGVMTSGALLMLASLPYFTVRIAKRVQYDHERSWQLCEQGLRRCPRREPKVYSAAFMLVPGAALAIAGITLLAIDPSGASSTLSDYPGAEGGAQGGRDTDHYLATGCVLVTFGGALLVAGSLHLGAHLGRRAAWRKHAHPERLALRLIPSFRPGPTSSTRSYGLALRAQF